MLTWVDEIQNGETHGRMKLIESAIYAILSKNFEFQGVD
jgi:hypothetical protein